MISALVFISVLGVLIFVHELGHFLLAKWNGVGVLEFAIGFGPILGTIKRGGTNYSLRAIPLGGFVRMVGDDPRLREEESVLTMHEPSAEENITAKYAELDEVQLKMVQDQSKWFINKGYFAKLGVVLAGPGFNFIFALILAISYYQFIGKPNPDSADIPRIGETIPDNPAQLAGIKRLDLVNSINGVAIKSWTELAETVSGSGGKQLTFVISRPESEMALDKTTDISINVTPSLELSEEIAAIEGKPAQSVYKVGISPYIQRIPSSGIIESIEMGSAHVYGMSKMLIQVIGGMLRGSVSTKNLGGPISIFKATSASAEQGFDSILRLMIFLNVSLAVFNLLPIPILDGGHLLFFTLEAVKGSPISIKALEWANRTGMVFLLLLMVFAFGNDIRRLFKL